jgi:8-oxo-dGTP pyrophosphatase MutT (NUDIX family)
MFRWWHAPLWLANAMRSRIKARMPDLPPPIPAATLILMRPNAGGKGRAPEILMMERAANMAFAAGALVFPGGRIDPQDAALAARFAEEDAAARIAAIRETIEETGIAAALLPAPDAETVAALRVGLAAGEELAGLLDRYGLTLDLAALTPFARWCPNFRETRRFDAHFYLAAAPANAHPASADDTESVRALWAPAADILAEIAQGEAHAIFPTRRNLERLARFASLDEARADATAHPVETVIPWIEERGGSQWLCIPENIGYPVTAEPLETARRS